MSFPPQSFYFIDGNTAIGQSTLNQIQAESGTFGIGATTSLIVDQVNASGVITASKFVGNIEGTVSGNISGTAGGLSGTPNIYVNAIDANRFHNTGVTTSQGGFDGDLTGNAGSATQLQNARNIGGVSFNGTADIDLPGVNIAGNQNTSGTAANLSGTPDIVVGNVTASNISIAGTLTYDDVTNVDSIGIVTARTGLDVLTGGAQIVGDSTIDGRTTIYGNVELQANLDVDGHVDLDNVNISGVTTFSSAVDINSSLEVGDIYVTAGTNVNGIVTASSFVGDQVIGTPAGGFKSGAFTINNTDHTKDSINELNFILGKLVPNAPDTFNGLSLSLTGTEGTAYLCQGFTPTNNTGGSAPTAGSAYTRNTDSTITTDYINDVGPGDSGTVTGFVNASNVGSISLNTNINDGTSTALQIVDNKDASESTRNTGITSQFYQVYDARLVNASSPDGYNKAFLTHGSATSGEVFWYEDPSTVSAPIISFSAVTSPSSPTLSYSSGVPHYTESTNNNFTYVVTVENASGDMYSYTNYKLLNSDGQTTGFTNAGHKFYNNFAGGTHPPARNFGVGTGVTTLITNTPNNIHTTITSGHFSSYDAVTPYGSHNNQAVSFSTNVNLMGTTATTSQIDEDNILISSLGTGSGNSTRVKAGSSGDTPSPSYTAWVASNFASTYEAIVRGGVLRHDETNYSTGYLPAGPDYRSGRSGAQYFQVELIRSNVSQFRISYTGSAAGCFVCMPNNSTWTTSLSGTNGWADMFQAYRGAGVPTSSESGCSSGGVMGSSGGTFTCTFGTESSSNDSNDRILIRWKLTSGQSITAMSFSAT